MDKMTNNNHRPPLPPKPSDLSEKASINLRKNMKRGETLVQQRIKLFSGCVTGSISGSNTEVRITTKIKPVVRTRLAAGQKEVILLIDHVAFVSAS